LSGCETAWHGPLIGVSYKCGAIQAGGPSQQLDAVRFQSFRVTTAPGAQQTAGSDSRFMTGSEVFTAAQKRDDMNAPYTRSVLSVVTGLRAASPCSRPKLA
jgi:hypothetical protein